MTKKEGNKWSLGQVNGITVYSCCIEVRRQSIENGPLRTTCGKREKITELTWKARRNLMFKVARCTTNFHSLMTLTYPYDSVADGSIVKVHLNKFFTYARRNLGAFEYWWFLEFQKRGMPHFHILTTLDLEIVRMEKEHFRRDFAYSWMGAIMAGGKELHNGTLVHQHPKAWEPLREPNAAQRYIMAYASKPYQKTVPENFRDVGRWWGISKGVKFEDDGVILSGDEVTLRKMLWYTGHKAADFEILPKYIFGSDKLSGQLMEGVEGDG